ncbi:MAG: ribbon-helix-helix protein, CopG family [Actinomycetota bacterium]
MVPLQQTTRVPREVGEQLHLLAAVTGVSEEEHLRLAVRHYLESAGREAEVAAFVDRARGRLRRVLDRLGDL